MNYKKNNYTHRIIEKKKKYEELELPYYYNRI